MSAKINVWEIVSGHFSTLKGETTPPRISAIDFSVFYGLPIIVSIGAASSSYSLHKDLAELLVNFGSILTALLLSVLVLVYDQEGKLRNLNDTKPDNFLPLKKKLLNQLYYNICYAIILSVFLALTCFIHVALGKAHATISVPKTSFTFDFVFGVWTTTPAAIFLAINVVLTVLMVVKRIHTLLVIAND